MQAEYQVFTDGGSRGNPGPSASGGVIFHQHKKIAELARFLGRRTNNQAEYQAVIQALDWFIQQKLSSIEIDFYLDSKLIVEQLNLRYRLKNPQLKTLFWQIQERMRENNLKCVFHYIPREKNKLADALVNRALDAALKK